MRITPQRSKKGKEGQFLLVWEKKATMVDDTIDYHTTPPKPLSPETQQVVATFKGAVPFLDKFLTPFFPKG